MLLVYGICLENALPHGPLPAGIDDMAVFLIQQNGLAAACSRSHFQPVAPTLADVRVYAAVVESLGKPGPALPMRFGCFLNEGEVRELLDKRRQEFTSTLDAVNGHVEMSVWVISETSAQETLEAHAEPPAPVAPKPALISESGTTYLARRRLEYQHLELSQQSRENQLKHLLQALSGLYSNHRHHQANHRTGQMRGVHFMVKTKNLEQFRTAFLGFQAQSADKVLLTGPWPAYHFSTPDE